MVQYRFLALAVGFVLDMIFGDPAWLVHPVVLIGKLIEKLEKIIRPKFPETPGGQKTGGTLLVVIVCALCLGLPWLVIRYLYLSIPVLGFIVESLCCGMLLAARSLKDESMKVYDKLKHGTITQARRAVAMIVGRDTESLSAEGVTKAAVETVAENTSDGVIAPMFYMAIGGAPLMFLYKAINTMDSMLGYKNEKYLCFGRTAAKLDDVVNYIPARISAWLMIAASRVIGMDTANAVRIFRRDRYNHASPNSAQTEAVMAGALNVQLAGDAWYFGKLYKKPFIGDPLRPVEPEDIGRANTLLYAASGLGVAVFTIAAYFLRLLF